MNVRSISPQELYDEVQKGIPVDVIDVRTPVEFREIHIPFARNLPLDRLDPNKLGSNGNGSLKTVYVICRSGNRSRRACETLEASGRFDVVSVDGGTVAWEQAGLPVVRGKKAISLERQVRMAAGALVLLGAVLGAFVSPYWIGLSAFVGAGLVFAGITDTCGMGMLLARMPWNQVPKTSATASPTACSTGSNSSASPCCG